MLWTICVILLVLWLLGAVGPGLPVLNGGAEHTLLVLLIILVILRLLGII